MKKYGFTQECYRTRVPKTLISLLILVLCLGTGALWSEVGADDSESSEDWSFDNLIDEVPYVPPVRQYTDQPQNRYIPANSGFTGVSPSTDTGSASSGGKKWSMPFGKKAKRASGNVQTGFTSPEGGGAALTQSDLGTSLPQPPRPQKKQKKGLFGGKKAIKNQGNQKPLTNEQIVNVGPRETAPSPDPLFRLPLPIEGNTGRMEPGIYLVKQKILDGSTRELLITRENKVMFNVLVHSEGSANPATPVQNLKIKNQPPKITTVIAKVADDQQSLTVQVKMLDERYISDPIPTITDTRKELKY